MVKAPVLGSMTWLLTMAVPLPLTAWAGLSASGPGMTRVPGVAWMADAWVPGDGRASRGVSLDRWLPWLASRKAWMAVVASRAGGAQARDGCGGHGGLALGQHERALRRGLLPSPRGRQTRGQRRRPGAGRQPGPGRQADRRQAAEEDHGARADQRRAHRSGAWKPSPAVTPPAQPGPSAGGAGQTFPRGRTSAAALADVHTSETHSQMDALHAGEGFVATCERGMPPGVV